MNRVLYNTDYSYSQQRDFQVIKMARVRSLILLKMSGLHWLTFPFSDPFHQIPLTSITTDTPPTCYLKGCQDRHDRFKATKTFRSV